VKLMQQEICDNGFDISDIETKRQQIGIMYLYWGKAEKERVSDI